MSTGPRLTAVLLLSWGLLHVAEGQAELGGHGKLSLVGQTYPANSLLRDELGRDSADLLGELRLNLSLRSAGWTFASDYQLLGYSGKTFVVPDDRRRLFDLSSIVTEGTDSALVHRLDRLWVGYANEKAVVRFGRQALSWGNGLFYAPMDLVNPFDPTIVDTEYKAGDDMLYVQYLRDNGADIQGAYVVRRRLQDADVDVDAATAAVKYHGFAGAGEFDLLVSRHYGDTVLGFGFGHPVGEAQMSGDIVLTDTDIDLYAQVSANLSYSWVMAGRNMTGSVEYHFNGFGQAGGRYDPAELAANPDLADRLTRGESFTAGRHYLAGSVLVEVSPLWTLSPVVLVNAGDPSGFLQLVSRYSLSDNMTFLASLSLPVGPDGTEFGGFPTPLPSRFLSIDIGVFAQIAGYF